MLGRGSAHARAAGSLTPVWVQALQPVDRALSCPPPVFTHAPSGPIPFSVAKHSYIRIHSSSACKCPKPGTAWTWTHTSLPALHQPCMQLRAARHAQACSPRESAAFQQPRMRPVTGHTPSPCLAISMATSTCCLPAAAHASGQAARTLQKAAVTSCPHQTRPAAWPGSRARCRTSRGRGARAARRQ